MARIVPLQGVRRGLVEKARADYMIIAEASGARSYAIEKGSGGIY
jgi:hypothetical protein